MNPIKMAVLAALVCLMSLVSFSTLGLEVPRGEYIQPDNIYPKVKIETNVGTIVVELERYKVKVTVDNFLSYVVAKRYDNTIFHRLEPEFVLQGGGYKADLEPVDEFPEIINESGSGIKNSQYTISMARQTEPHSATSQFFFNLVDNESLDPGKKWGYTAFGSVIEGEEVLEKIIKIGTGFSEELGWPNYPNQEIKIISAQILSE